MYMYTYSVRTCTVHVVVYTCSTCTCIIHAYSPIKLYYQMFHVHVDLAE